MVGMRIALVGDRSPSVRSHTRVPWVMEALREHDGIALDPYWIPTTDVAAGLDGFDGVWLLPGSPYRDEAGAVEAVRVAREGGLPFLGTCAGFQHMLLEYARHVCGLDVAHAENDPAGRDFLLTPLACSLAGHESLVRLTPGTLVARIVAARETLESYICSYGLNESYRDALTAGGLVFSGHAADDGAARVAELPGHPFFLATLFQPELAERDGRAHPVISAFAAAVARRAAELPA
ncbi:CTP synthase [Nonomuraea coxensis DSM 45129]|uniref:CTP synthase (glutamine hydrolyzing) n=2 Tax=Nonomuraea coxensis TaxID=404386 RepID=A0ABX8U3F7_9ACTN|nr:CTP synthase [Nonomuraea coxensis DSM 45129]